MDKEPLIYIDGKYYPKSEAKISVYDHGLLYGDGVFEGIRAYNGSVFKLKEHIDRLYRSAHTIMLQMPMKKQEMMKAVVETLKKNNLNEGYVRLVVTRGIGDLGLDPRKCAKPTVIVIAQPSKALHGDEAKEKGVTAIISWVRRNPVDATSSEIKSLNYLNSVLAKIEANVSDVDDAICLNKEGLICEGSGENIFIVKDNEIATPPLCTGALDGITRKCVIEIAKKIGYTVTERNITPNEIFNADEVFFTGTFAEIVPIIEINKRVINDGKPGPITKRLIQEFSKLVKDPKEGTPIK